MKARRVLGWCIHAYTGCGLFCAAAVVSLLVQPERTSEAYRYCFLWMLLAVFVDATDGMLARAVRIKETIPEFDGRRLDDLVDFLMYTCLPLLLVDRAGLLPDGLRWVLLVALAASAYGFCQSDVKTEDGAFVGFPSYWNVIAFYLVTLPFSGNLSAVLILVFALLTFVPTRYPYPTQPGRLNRWMLVLSIPWTALLLADLLQSWSEPRSRWEVWVSLVYPALYLGTAWLGSVRRFTRDTMDGTTSPGDP